MFLRRSICSTFTLARNLSSQAKLVDVSVNDKTGIATVSMNRSPVNGLNLDLLRELSNTFSKLEDNRCRGMILTSNLGTIFSGGLDIMEMYQPNIDRLRTFWTTLQDTWIALFGSPYPTVAVINGHSPAGGCLLATSCEYRIMLNNFTIGLNETQLGLAAPKWFMDTFRNTINVREAELALTQGRLYKTEEALQVGLIDEIAANKEEGLERANAFFARFARVSPIARAATKQFLRGNIIHALEENRDNDTDIVVAMITQESTQRALGKYIEALKQKKA